MRAALDFFLVDQLAFRRYVVGERHEVVACVEIIRDQIAEMRKHVISVNLLLCLVDGV